MVHKYRELFNQEFTDEKYALMKEMIYEKTGQYTGFRLCETPVFLPYSFREKILYAAESILYQINKIPTEIFDKAVPAHRIVPHDTEKPHFLCIDFGICRGADGKPIPQLIELQAFPSLYAFEELHRDVVFEVFPFLSELSQRIPYDQLIEIMKEVIVGDEDPKHVILMDIFPEQQKTKIDFKITEDLLGIKTVCLSKIKKYNRKIYYENDGELIQIKRIYNRVVLDELDRIEDFHPEFNIREEVDVDWVAHPNWYYKISKYILPLLEHTYIPESYYANEFPADENIEDYVLKSLYTLSGVGINLNPTKEDLDNLKDPSQYILQKKVEYANVFKDPNGDFAKGEIRMLFIWKPGDEFPTFLNNMVTLTKSDRMNEDFNIANKIWTGNSFALFVK